MNPTNTLFAPADPPSMEHTSKQYVYVSTTFTVHGAVALRDALVEYARARPLSMQVRIDFEQSNGDRIVEVVACGTDSARDVRAILARHGVTYP